MSRDGLHEAKDPLSASMSSSRTRPKYRISHTKSRNGCFQCKNRRVKCDEERPICGACSIRGNECAFPHPQETRDQKQRRHLPCHVSTRQGEGQPTIPLDSRRPPIYPLDFNMPGARAPNLDLKSSALNLHDLNLLQHYILHTSKNFSLNSRKSFIWERIIPEIAAKNVFLMHLLLAVSGLNLLTAQTPDKRTSLTLDSTELRTLVEHHQKGLQGLQERLASIEETNAEVLFAGSMLIVAFAFGSLRAQNLEFLAQPSQNTSPRDYTFPGHSSSFGKPHIQWLRLVRGVSSIARHSWKALKISRLRPLLLFSNSNEDWRLLGPGPLPTSVSPGCARSEKLSLFATGATRAILGLRIFWRTLKVARLDTDSLAPSPTSSTSPDINGDPERDEFFTSQEQAISVVEQMYQRIIYVLQLERIEPCSSTRDIQAELEDAAITSWPHLLPETFVSSLDSEGSPDIPTGLSFIILAHLYLLLTLLHELWYLGENFAVEIRKIHKLVADLGDPELFSLMEWPMNVVNSKSDGS